MFHLFLYFISKDLELRVNATHYFIVKIPNKRELQQIASNYSSDIGHKEFLKLYKGCTKETYLFLVNDVTLSWDNPLRTYYKNDC